MNWTHCITQFDVMRSLKIGHSDYAYLDYVHRTAQSDLADDGWCCETNTDIGRRIVLSKSAVGRMRAKMIDRGLLKVRKDGAVQTSDAWRKALQSIGSETQPKRKKRSETQPHVATPSSETLPGSSETLQQSSETQHDTYIYKGTKGIETKATCGRAREDDINLVEVYEPDLPELEAAPVKEKSSAKKESALDRRAKHAAEQIKWQPAQAKMRHLSPVPTTPLPQPTPEDIAERAVAEAATPEGQRTLYSAYVRAGLDPEKPVNLYAAAYAYAQFELKHDRPIATNLLGKLPGYLRAQRSIDARMAQNDKRAKSTPGNSTRRRADGRVKDCPSTTDWSDLSDLLPPSSARPAQTA